MQVVNMVLGLNGVQQQKTIVRIGEDIMKLEPTEKYDLVLCWGVLHHLKSTSEGFAKVASQVKPDGFLQIMVYHKDTQAVYELGRRMWQGMTEDEKLAYCEKFVTEKGGTIHGWWDAFNPDYNHSFHHNEIRQWFEKAGFKDIRLIKKYNINMIGRKATRSRGLSPR